MTDSIAIPRDTADRLRLHLAKIRCWMMGVAGIDLGDADLEALEETFRLLRGDQPNDEKEQQK